jgi:Flp pilus assembly protein TadD
MDNELEANMHYVHAGQYYDAGNYSAAISECSTAISKGIQDVRIYNMRAYSYMKQGEALKARLDFEASLKLNPTDSWVRDKIVELKNKGY